MRYPRLSNLGREIPECLARLLICISIGAADGLKAVTANPNPEAGRAVFATTHWSIVLEAARPNSPRASEAMAQLCTTYWYPIYAYVRRKGYQAHDAQDLTQEFFSRLIAGNYVG